MNTTLAKFLRFLIPALALSFGVGFVTINASDNHGEERIATDALPSVESSTVHTSNTFSIERQYLGLLEAARKSRLGFELDGKIESVLVDEGDRVEAGKPLAKLDTARLRAAQREAKAALEQAESGWTLAQSTLKRVQAAFAANAISDQQLEEAQEALKAAKAQFDRAAASLDTIEVELSKSVLFAPYDGLVTRRNLDEGTVAPAGQPVLEIIEADVWNLRVGLPADLASGMRPGQSHLIRKDKLQWDATVSRVLPSRNAATRTVDVILSLPPVDAHLFEGDVMHLVLVRERAESGIWVPRSALTEAERGLWSVYRLRQDSPSDEYAILQPVPVEILHLEEEAAYVRGPLNDGDTIATAGLQSLSPGQWVSTISTTGPAPELASAGRP